MRGKKMTSTIKEHDFIEVEYTGKFPDGKVFDTTDKELAQKESIFSQKMKYGSVVICVGEGNVVKGLDTFIVGKEVGKNYTVKLEPEAAFGKKDFKKIKLVPISEFTKQGLNPQPRMQIDFDGEMGTVIRAAGGRVMVNFNHPFAGREVEYEVKINKKVEEVKEQVESYLNIMFNSSKVKAEVTGDKAVVDMGMDVPEPMQQMLKEKLNSVTKLKEVEFKKKV